jgi:hypothetical protein
MGAIDPAFLRKLGRTSAAELWYRSQAAASQWIEERCFSSGLRSAPFFKPSLDPERGFATISMLSTEAGAAAAALLRDHPE